MGAEPLNSVGSKSTCIFECVCMHRIGDWILSVTTRPFQPSQGGFPLYPILQSAKILLKSHPFSSDNFKKGWDIIKLIFFISHSAQTGKIHFFRCKYSMKKHNFPKKYSSKGTFSRNTWWCLSMSGWTGCLYLWNHVCRRYLQHLWWAWCISFKAELLPFPSFKIPFL